jgi:hypothetical protein
MMGRALLFSDEICQCPQLRDVVSQLFLSLIIFDFVTASIFLKQSMWILLLHNCIACKRIFDQCRSHKLVHPRTHNSWSIWMLGYVLTYWYVSYLLNIELRQKHLETIMIIKLSGSYTSIIFNLYGDYEVSVPGRTNKAYIWLKASNVFCDVTVTENLGKGHL